MEGFTPAYKNRSKPKAWPLINNTALGEFVKTALRASTKNTSKDGTCPLFGYQRFLKDFIQYKSPYRGILMYYGLGTGKTRASIAAAEAMSAKLDIVVMVPASLQKNYMSEIMACGNTAFSLNRKWRFVSKKDITDEDDRLHVEGTIVTKNKGVWVPYDDEDADEEDDEGQSWDSLDDKTRAAIIAQVESSMTSRYHFIKYNGLSQATSQAKIKRMMNTRFFDNKVVIIDEIHNFISSVVNGSKILGLLYTRLLKAKNVKIIALSGTPLINKPIELAYIMNLVRGPMTIYELEFEKSKKSKKGSKKDSSFEDKIKKYLEENPYVDTYKFVPGKRTLQIALVPYGFAKAGENGFVHRVKHDDDENPIDDIKQALTEEYGMTIVNDKQEDIKLLPQKSEDFEHMFGITKTGKIKNSKVLSRRLQGLVSFFNSYDPEQYPSVSERNIVKVKMTPEIFYTYERLRDNEREEERRRNRGDNDDKKSDFTSTYRILSRMACIFTFPTDIDRPYPSDMKRKKIFALDAVDNVDDDIEDEEDEESKTKNRSKKLDAIKKTVQDEYEEAKRMTLAALSSKHLKRESLAKHGPKYVAILKKMDELERGTALVYTQFRGLEGIGIMHKIMMNEGYSMMDCVKKRDSGSYELKVTGKKKGEKGSFIVFSDDKEKNRVLMNIFNSDFDKLPLKIVEDLRVIAKERGIKGDKFESKKNIYGDLIKAIFITKSGSEGISLKNVRQVHIMEPYWNDIRIQQVIGRAVRAGSHLALPKHERTVDVFVYVMVFGNKEQKDADGGLTTDQHILEVAEQKAEVIQALEDVMRSSSIDCEFNKSKHEGMQCMKIPEGFGKYAYMYQDVSLDERDTSLEKRTKGVKAKREFKVIGNKTRKLIFFTDTDGIMDGNKAILYEYPKEEDKTKLTRVGYIELDLKTMLPKNKTIVFDA